MQSKKIKLFTFSIFILLLCRELSRLFFFYRSREKRQETVDFWNKAIYKERIKQVEFNDLASFFAPHKKDLVTPKKIDILIPVYNGYDFLKPCLDSVLKYTDIPFHIYLVNDKSPDERVLPLLREYESSYPDKITVFENEKNLGFLKSTNFLISKSENDFVLLNSDTQVTEGWASSLFEPIFADSRVGAAGPWSNAASFQSVWFRAEEKPLQIPLEQMNKLAKGFTQNALFSMPYLMGFCLAISRKAAQEVGLLDPVYGKGYYEETDWLKRALAKGYKVALVLSSFVYHKGTSSFSAADNRLLCKKNVKIFKKRYPNHFKELKYIQYDSQYIAARFMFLAKYLRVIYPSLQLTSADKPAEEVCFSWKKQGNSYLYELFLEGKYEALKTNTSPEVMDALTKSNKKGVL